MQCHAVVTFSSTCLYVCTWPLTTWWYFLAYRWPTHFSYTLLTNIAHILVIVAIVVSITLHNLSRFAANASSGLKLRSGRSKPLSFWFFTNLTYLIKSFLTNLITTSWVIRIGSGCRKQSCSYSWQIWILFLTNLNTTSWVLKTSAGNKELALHAETWEWLIPFLCKNNYFQGYS